MFYSQADLIESLLNNYGGLWTPGEPRLVEGCPRSPAGLCNQTPRDASGGKGTRGRGRGREEGKRGESKLERLVYRPHPLRIQDRRTGDPGC